MDRRISQGDTAQRVMNAIRNAHLTVESVAQATGIPQTVLSGIEPFGVTDLAKAGGFLRIHPAELIGAAA